MAPRKFWRHTICFFREISGIVEEACSNWGFIIGVPCKIAVIWDSTILFVCQREGCSVQKTWQKNNLQQWLYSNLVLPTIVTNKANHQAGNVKFAFFGGLSMMGYTHCIQFAGYPNMIICNLETNLEVFKYPFVPNVGYQKVNLG